MSSRADIESGEILLSAVGYRTAPTQAIVSGDLQPPNPLPATAPPRFGLPNSLSKKMSASVNEVDYDLGVKSFQDLKKQYN